MCPRYEGKRSTAWWCRRLDVLGVVHAFGEQHWSVRAIAMSRPGYAQSGEEAVYVPRLLQATDLITRQPQ
jgi:hypothetical protein